MKHSVVALSALVAAAQAAQPAFTNAAFDVQPNQSFTLTWNQDGCTTGCTIKLKSGGSTNLADVGPPLATGTNGSSFTLMPSLNWPDGPLAFEIVNKQGQNNYSPQFAYAGTGAVPSAGAGHAAPISSAGAIAIGSSPMAGQTTSVSDSPMVTGASSMTPALTTSSMSTATMNTARNMTMTSIGSRPMGMPDDTIPTSSVDRMSASLALVAGVAAVMVCLD